MKTRPTSTSNKRKTSEDYAPRQQKKPRKGRVAMVCDSTGRGMARVRSLTAFAWRQGWDMYLTRGAKIPQLTHTFEDIDLRDYDKVIFMGGTNDLSQMAHQTRSGNVETLADIVARCERVVKYCQRHQITLNFVLPTSRKQSEEEDRISLHHSLIAMFTDYPDVATFTDPHGMITPWEYIQNAFHDGIH